MFENSKPKVGTGHTGEIETLAAAIRQSGLEAVAVSKYGKISTYNHNTLDEMAFESFHEAVSFLSGTVAVRHEIENRIMARKHVKILDNGIAKMQQERDAVLAKEEA